MEAFEDYYQGCPDFKTLVVRVVPAANLTAGLLNGDIDVVGMGSTRYPTGQLSRAQTLLWLLL